MTNNRPIPARGEIYRHFKGTEYKVIAVTLGDNFLNAYDAPTHWAKHTETEQTLGCWYEIDGDNAWATFYGELVRDRLVIYWADSDQPGLVWARPLDNFLEMILSGANDGTASNYYRFEKVEGAAS